MNAQTYVPPQFFVRPPVFGKKDPWGALQERGRGSGRAEAAKYFYYLEGCACRRLSFLQIKEKFGNFRPKSDGSEPGPFGAPDLTGAPDLNRHLNALLHSVQQ